MTRSSATPAITFITLTLILLLSGNALSADQRATADDGRKVLLKEDGSWTYTDDAPSIISKPVSAQNLDIKLKKVVVETYKVKTQKSSRIKTQTVFYLHINNTRQEKTDIDIEHKDISLIEVKDNNGKNYPVLSIKADIASLQYGKGITVVVRAEKSPALLDSVNAMKIILKPGIFGIQNMMSLTQRVTDFEELNVDGFK